MYPKILFIADEIPQSVNAGSIQFLRLFENYPPDNIIIIGKKKASGAVTLPCKYYELNYPFHERLRLSRFASHLTDLQSMSFLLPKLPKTLQKVADEFKPDVVVSLMQLLSYYYPAYDYARERNLPFVLFCHDDVEDFARPHSFFKNRLVKLNSKIYKAAVKRICISPEMVTSWKKKYEADGDFLYPIASEKLYPRPLHLAKKLIQGTNLTIGYAGSLAYGYREGISEISGILEKTNTVLKIYRDNDGSLPSSKSLIFAGYAPTAEITWERIKKECDAVILPYSSDIRFQKLYMTHFPSKLPEYISLGMPVIVVGPEYATGLRWAKTKLLAGGLHDLEKLILKLKDSPDERINLSKSSEAIGDFDLKLTLQKLQTLLQK